MKLFRNAIILVIVLGLLGGAYFYLNNRNSGKDDGTASDPTQEEEISVTSGKQEDVISIEFVNEKGSYKLVKKDNAWSMEPGMEFPINSSYVDSAASDLSDVNANKIIEEKASDLGKYGLDKPTASVKVGMKDGSIQEIEVGAATPTSDGLYIKKKGEDKVYVVGLYYKDKLTYSRGYFAVKDILPVDPNTLKKLSYEKNGEMQFDLDIKSEGDVDIVAPVKEKAEASDVTAMTNAVVQLSIADIVDESPDLAQYGLDKPAFALEYGDGKTTKKILFGKELEKGKTAYAKYPDGKSVFTVDISALTFLDVKYSNIVSSFVFLPNINDVNKVELTIDGKTIVSDITTVKDDSDKDTFKVDGKDANVKSSDSKSLFRSFYSSMIGITMSRYDTGAKPAGTPEVTIKYFMKPDSKPVTIEYISKDQNYFYTLKDGVDTNRLVLKSVLDEPDGIRASYKALKEAIDKGEKK